MIARRQIDRTKSVKLGLLHIFGRFERPSAWHVMFGHKNRITEAKSGKAEERRNDEEYFADCEGLDTD